MFAIKTEVADQDARTLTFSEQKTMHGAKKVAAGDTIFIFASVSEGGAGLVAMGRVTSATAAPRKLVSSVRRHESASSCSALPAPSAR